MELREPGVQNSPMCLLALAWNVHPRWRLLLAGNRDEFHARPTAPLAPWASAPHVLAAHSMGGHIVMRALIERAVDPDAVVLSAPMLGMAGPPLPLPALHWLLAVPNHVGP